MGIELAPESTEDVSVSLTPVQPPVVSQPAFQPDPVKLDEKQVRAAMQQAADSGVDPFSLAVSDLNPPKELTQAQVEPPVEIPERFKKPNGEVDVEKLKTSTKQLDEALQKKEQKIQEIADQVQKTPEEMFLEYKALQKKMVELPNVDKLQAAFPPSPPAQPSVPVNPSQLTDEQLESMINADIGRNPARAMAEFTKLQLEKMIGPLLEERKDESVRKNIRALAESDPRVLNPAIFAAINDKLNTWRTEDPARLQIKNPHKVAWLEVKEDLRLGEQPKGVQAQPSRPPSPILGGGTPPPAPSSSPEMATQATIFAAAEQLGRDPRDRKYNPKEQAALDSAAKKYFDELDRKARRF